MIELLQNKIKQLRSVKQNMSVITIRLLKGEEEVIIEMNRQQMWQGIRADGTEIEPEYKSITVSIKTQNRQPTNRVTLKDTGDHYEGIYVEWGKNYLYLESSDWKKNKLMRKYKKEIYGLTDGNLQKLIEKIKEPLFNEISSMIQSKELQAA